MIGITLRHRHPLVWLLELGTQGYGPQVRRRLNVLNATAALIVLFSSAYALFYAVTDPHAFRWVIAINLALITVALCVPAMHRVNELLGGFLIIAAECPALFCLVALLGRDSGVQLNLIIGATAAFFVFGGSRPILAAATVLACFALHVAAWFLFPAGLVPVKTGFLAQLYIGSAVTVFGLTAAVTYYSFHLVELAETATEALLNNILPGAIIERLRARPGESIAEAFDRASILFSDIEGFVPLSKNLGATRTVSMLNEMMRRFDALADKHGVEKIKTIGDSYMAAAGLPVPATDHADRLARMGLDMLVAKDEVAEQFGVAIHMRVGIASGPVMAGIIGTHKFSYDVWGDAVNLAARLETSGEAERIQVSADARAAMSPGLFDFESRGEIEIRGLGLLETWFLRSRPADLGNARTLS